MDYLETLPPDVLRQTALSMDPADVFELSLDPKFKKILNEKFWEDKLKINKFQPRDPDIITQFEYIIEEPFYNQYLYKYYRFLQERIFYNNLENIHNKIAEFPYERNSIDELKEMKQALDLSLNLSEFAERIKERLIQVRGKTWPRLYNEMNRPNVFRQYDGFVDGEKLFIKVGDKLRLINLDTTKFNKVKLRSLFENFGVNYSNLTGYLIAAVNQIYLL